MNSPQNKATEITSGKVFSIVLVVVAIISISGLFMGMRHVPKENLSEKLWQDRKEEHAVDASHIPVAPRYKQIPGYHWQADYAWENKLSKLPTAKKNREQRKTMSKEERAQVVKLRNSRRAYDGAPPVIPHAIQTMDVKSCFVCHSQDSKLVIAGKNTPKISHPYYTSCTQCHAPSEGANFLKGASKNSAGLQIKNSFTGKPSPGIGSRAYKGAPPTMPHRVNMRQNCMACHGEGMSEAISTSHPQRQNCLQCHAPNARFDNRERFDLQQFMKK